MKQLRLFKTELNKEFGGALIRGKRKSRRPMNTKAPVHLVLKTDVKCSVHLGRHFIFCTKTLDRFAKRFQIKIYEKAIVRDHLHLLIKVECRGSYQGFVRAVTGRMAQVLKLKWLYRPYTRWVTWGRDFQRVRLYVYKNQLEADGAIAYQPRSQGRRRPPP